MPLTYPLVPHYNSHPAYLCLLWLSMPKQPLKLASPGDMGASCEKCTPVFLVLLSHTRTVSVRRGGKSIRLSTGTHGAKTAHSMALPTFTVKAGTVFRGCLSDCRKITCSFRKLSGACMDLGAVCPPVPIILTYPSHQSFPEPIFLLCACSLGILSLSIGSLGRVGTAYSHLVNMQNKEG